jgi:succinate dehydrogenase / fumarate reductase cytochrome b subunit
MTELAKKAARVPQHQPPGPPDLSLAPAGIVSILHRVSGLLMFLLLPFIIWMFDNSLSSEFSFESSAPSTSASASCRAGSSSWSAGLIWAYLHHFIAVCATCGWT